MCPVAIRWATFTLAGYSSDIRAVTAVNFSAAGVRVSVVSAYTSSS